MLISYVLDDPSLHGATTCCVGTGQCCHDCRRSHGNAGTTPVSHYKRQLASPTRTVRTTTGTEYLKFLPHTGRGYCIPQGRQRPQRICGSAAASIRTWQLAVCRDVNIAEAYVRADLSRRPLRWTGRATRVARRCATIGIGAGCSASHWLSTSCVFSRSTVRGVGVAGRLIGGNVGSELSVGG